MKYFIILFIPIMFALIGCKEDSISSIDNNKNKNVYPLKIGNQWIYSVGDTITIDKTTTLNGKTAHHIYGDDDYTFGYRNLYYEGSVLYGWDGADTVASQIFDESILSALPIEKITVPAGTFDTYKYSWGNVTTEIYWFSKGIGVVKVEKNGNVIELTKYTLK